MVWNIRKAAFVQSLFKKRWRPEMKINPLGMQYPLKERIGNPELLVGRENDFAKYRKWISGIPEEISKSWAILSRKKGGKTSFVQRLFNEVWSANGSVIPFYMEIKDQKVWYPEFSVRYYETFVSQFISFLERDPSLVQQNLSLEEIRAYGVQKSDKILVTDVDYLLGKQKSNSYDLMWDRVSSAPHRFAVLYKKFFLVILDEFQNISKYVYREEGCKGDPDETMAGGYHEHSESKVAPMLVTGSDVGWLVNIIDQYLEGGRLSKIRISPYLTIEEGQESVYRYTEIFEVPTTNECIVHINDLCMSDPFFIACVVRSRNPQKDLTTWEGVVGTVLYELGHLEGEFSQTWLDYFQNVFGRVNERYAKQLLLHLTKHYDRIWTPTQLKEALQLEYEPQEIQEKLKMLHQAGMIRRMVSPIQYFGLQDGVFYLILRYHFEDELQNYSGNWIEDYQEEIRKAKKEKDSLRGALNNAQGKIAEMHLALELYNRSSFFLSEFFTGAEEDSKLQISQIKTRYPFQKPNGQNGEFDIKADLEDGRILLVEVKKRQQKTSITMVEEFQEKVQAFSSLSPQKQIISAFLSLGGFTDDALQLCKDNKIVTATRILYSHMD